MGTLHLVNHPDALGGCLAVAGVDDEILLLENGVYAAIAGQAPDRPLHALEVDVRARGIGARLAGQVDVISDAGFVVLVERHSPVVTWRR